MSDDRPTDPEELRPSVLQLARQAERSAKASAESSRKAEEHALAAHDGIGRLHRHQVRTDVRIGKLEERDKRDAEEITLVRDLRKAGSLWRRRFWTVTLVVIGGAAGTVAAAEILHWLRLGTP